MPQAHAQTDPVVTIERRVSGSPGLDQGATATEGATLRFTVSASPAPSGSITVNLQASGGAAFGIIQGPFTVRARSSGTTNIAEDTTNDALDEVDAVVTYTVLPGTGYTVGMPSSATVTIEDDDRRPGAPSISSVGEFARTLGVAWRAPTNPGYSDGTGSSHTDNTVTAYDARHILTSATDKTDGQWTVVDDAWTGGILEHAIQGLTAGQSYDVQVRAVTRAGDGPWSGTSRGTPRVDTFAPGLSHTAPPSVNGAALTLTYDEPLDTGSVPASSAFVVTVDGATADLADVNPVTISGRAVTLTLASAVAPGATVTVSYAAPGTNPIQDEVGHDAGDLSDEVVTNATPGVLLEVSRLVVYEGGSNVYTVALAARPSGDVTVAITSDNPDVTIDDTDTDTDGVQNTLTFTTTDWSTARTVTVRAADDADTATESATLTHAIGGGTEYDGLDDPALAVTVRDDDGGTAGPALSTATPPSVTGAALTLTYEETLDADSVPAASAFAVKVDGSAAVLAGAAPVAIGGRAVTLTLARAVPAGAKVTVSYTAPGTSPIQDAAGDDAGNLSDLAVTNATPGVLLSVATLSLAEGGSRTYEVGLAVQPSESVTVALASSNPEVTVDDTDRMATGVQNTLTFTTTSWSAAQRVTVRAADDADAADDSAMLTHAIGGASEYESLAGPTLPVTVHDNEADPTAPTLSPTTPPSMTAPTILTLTYNEALDTGSVPAASAFLVRVDGSTAGLAGLNPVAMSGRAVALTLASGVTAGQSVRVRYTAPAANPIRDEAGHSAANLRGRAVQNLTGDTRAPVLRSATITDATLVLRYDEALDEGAVPAASAFEVWVAGARVSVEDMAVDGRAVRLTLASAAEHGDTVSVHYAPPSANPIRDPAGNEAANTGHRVVTNNTPARGDTTAPALRSATITDATLVLAYSEGLDQDSVPAASAFEVWVAGATVPATGVAADGARVKLTLASVAAHGEAVTVSYAAPPASPIRDPAGNRAANLSRRAVRNETPAPGDTTAPTLRSATITDDRIVLTYDEPLDENSVPSPGAFRATTRRSWRQFTDVEISMGVDRVAVAGRTVTLTLRPSQMICGAATVSYDVPGGYPIRDPSGNAAGRLVERAVTSAPNTPGITVTAPTPSPLPEGGSATFTVKLDAMPCRSVKIELSSDNPDVTAPHHRVLSFHKVTGSGRWDRPQTVTLISRQDHDAADETATLTLRVRDESPAAYRSLADVTVTVEVADDDAAALSVADARVEEEAGATLDFAVTLDRARHVPVTVDYATSNGTATAGEDYTAASGTLTFAAGETAKTVRVAVLDDAVDEGAETLVLTLSNASEAAIADGEATGTITNADPLQKVWLSRFGRTVAGHLTDAVSDRLAAPLTGAQVTVGGRRIDLAGRKDEAWLGETLTSLARALGAEQETGPEGEGGPGSDLGVRESPAPVGSPARPGPGREVLLGSAFHLARAGDGGGPGLAAWGRVTAGGFDGAAPSETGDVGIDGDVTTGVLGADAEWDRLLAGVAVSVSEGEGTFDLPGVDSGTVESTMTTVSPYARMALTDRVSAWGLVGWGTGDMTIVQAANDRGQPERVTRTDLGMRLAAVGGRGALLQAGETGGMDLALKTDAFFVQTESEAVSNEGATTADASRVRLILEGTRAFDLGDGAVLTPGLELGLRHDGGDAETGAGVELGGRVSFAAAGSGLSLEASVRTLVAHEVSGYEEWGASGAVRLAPGASGRGLSFRLAPTWGAPSSGAERLWSARDARALSPDGTFEPEGRLEAGLGYGHRVGGAFTGTPYAGLGLSGEARDWRIGWRLAPAGAAGAKSGFSLNLEGTRSESATAEPDHAIGLTLRAKW